MPSPKLDAREYKLLLKPEAFAGTRGQALMKGLWQKRLEPVIIEMWQRQRVGKANTRGDLRLTEERTVQFYDTVDGLLAINALSLRRRETNNIAAARAKSSPAEWTLKLRTPDLFIAAAARFSGTTSSAKSKLEEDIAPLPPERKASVQSRSRSVPAPHLTRSRFSQSTRQVGGTLKSTRQLLDLFPTLAAYLEIADVTLPKRSEPLLGGARVAEKVFEGAEVELGGGMKAEFALSLWNVDAEDSSPKAAEISFKCKLDAGAMRASAAMRAYHLFAAIQRELAPIVETRELSKTALVIPKRIGAP